MRAAVAGPSTDPDSTALPPVVVIVGPTAVGKTEVTLAVAERVGAEVVSADSMQVYRGLDVGTAKPSPAERKGIPHHLIDIVEPDVPFSVGDWVGLARPLLESIRERGKIPLVSGGTPLYHEALFGRFALTHGAEPAFALRESLRRQERCYGPGYLHRLLSAVDSAAAGRIHPADLKRTVRALEVYLETGRPLTALEREAGPRAPQVPGRVLFIGLWRPREELAERIDARLEAMLAAGLVDEVRGLMARGVEPHCTSMQGVGYKEIVEYLEGRTDLAEAVRRIARNTRRLAKRQMTWFKTDGRIRWIRAGMNIQVSVEDIVTMVGGKT